MPVDSDLVVRDRVDRRLNDAAQFAVILIVAPGGYGKSVALARCLEMSTRPHVRCVVSSIDQTARAFAQRLLGALSLDPVARETLEDALGSHVPPAELAVLFARHLAHYDGLIAVDDFHYALDESAAAFLTTLVDASVPHVHWVIASRSLKELPVAEWIARGTCGPPISSEDLAFTMDEAIAAASVLSGICEEDDVRKILALREFPLAFILAIRFARTGASASTFVARARELSSDYLARHVYDVLTADEQRHLQFGALLRTFDCALFEEAGFSNARRVLRRLYRQGYFLSRGDGFDQYTCNDVFLEFLCEQLRNRPAEEQRTLMTLAADVLRAHDRPVEAALLYFEAREFSSLLTLLERKGIQVMESGWVPLVKESLKLMPRALVEQSAMALAFEALLIGDDGRHAQAEALFLRALEQCTDAEQRTSISYYFALDQVVSKVQDAAARFLEVANTPGVNHTLRLLALSNRVLALAWMDPFYDVGPEIDEIYPMIDRCERDADRSSILTNLATAALYAGDDRAEGLFARTEEAAQRKGFVSDLRASFRRRALFALYCDNDLSAARAAAERRPNFDGSPQFDRAGSKRSGLILEILLAVSAGDASSVQMLLDDYAQQPATDSADYDATINRARAMLAAWRGDFEGAYKLLQPTIPYVFSFYRPAAQALCTIAAAAAGEPVDAVIEEQMKPFKAAKARVGRWAEREHVVRALLAIAASISGKNTVAMRLLGASSPDLTRLPILLREVVGLLGDQREDRTAAEVTITDVSRAGFNDIGAFLRPLFHAREMEHARSGLTDAEIAVLRLLKQGLKPKEIADLRGASIHTVRKQLQNARLKLGSDSTERLIARASALGVL